MKLRLAIILTGALLSANAFAADDTSALEARIAELEAQVAAHEAERAQTARHLEIFDELDLVAFNRRDMKRIGRNPRG